jgi:hypothetical protein
VTDAVISETECSLSHSMIELVRGMAQALVDQPEQVSVDSRPDGDGTVLLPIWAR